MTAFLVWALLCVIVAYFGKDRKFGFWGNLACSILFTPIIGLIVVLASDKRPIPVVVVSAAEPSGGL